VYRFLSILKIIGTSWLYSVDVYRCLLERLKVN
jgi:hypothetical protein